MGPGRQVMTGAGTPADVGSGEIWSYDATIIAQMNRLEDRIAKFRGAKLRHERRCVPGAFRRQNLPRDDADRPRGRQSKFCAGHHAYRVLVQAVIFDPPRGPKLLA